MAKAIDELCKLANDTAVSTTLWSVLNWGKESDWNAEQGGEMLSDRLRSIADRAKLEHAEELAAKDAELDQLREDLAERRELTAEAREVVERLRALGNSVITDREIYHAIDETIDFMDMSSGVKLRDRLIDEETNTADARVMLETVADRIRKAVDGATEPDRHSMLPDGMTSFDFAACMQDLAELTGLEYEEAHAVGFLDEANGVIDEYRKTLVKIGCMLGFDDGELPPLPELLLGELDKRLIPQGMEWPRFEDGERVEFGPLKSPMWSNDKSVAWQVNSIEILMSGDRILHARKLDDTDAARIVLPNGQRVKRPEPEVLGADGVPIKPGEKVHNEFKNFIVAEVHASNDPFGNNRPWVLYANAGWDFANVVEHGWIDTQESIDEDASMPPRRYYADKIGHDVGLKDDEEVFAAVALHLLLRQRELDARTMGGE